LHIIRYATDGKPVQVFMKGRGAFHSPGPSRLPSRRATHSVKCRMMQVLAPVRQPQFPPVDHPNRSVLSIIRNAARRLRTTSLDSSAISKEVSTSAIHQPICK
jgi:hypothetical protein